MKLAEREAPLDSSSEGKKTQRPMIWFASNLPLIFLPPLLFNSAFLTHTSTLVRVAIIYLVTKHRFLLSVSLWPKSLLVSYQYSLCMKWESERGERNSFSLLQHNYLWYSLYCKLHKNVMTFNFKESWRSLCLYTITYKYIPTLHFTLHYTKIHYKRLNAQYVIKTKT